MVPRFECRIEDGGDESMFKSTLRWRYDSIFPSVVKKRELCFRPCISESIFRFTRYPLVNLHKPTYRTPHLASRLMSSLAASDSPGRYRLPIDVRPTHYEIAIRSDLEKLIFDGCVRIQ
jgi:hypothetical protein